MPLASSRARSSAAKAVPDKAVATIAETSPATTTLVATTARTAPVGGTSLVAFLSHESLLAIFKRFPRSASTLAMYNYLAALTGVFSDHRGPLDTRPSREQLKSQISVSSSNRWNRSIVSTVTDTYHCPRNSREGLHRGGAGKGGWGKPGEEASLVPEFTAEGEQEEIVPDEPDNEVTLEDYEKAKAERKTALMASLKQKNKGGASKTVDESAFTGMKLTSKDDGVDVLSSFELEGSETIKGKRVRTKNGVQKTILDTGFKTTPSAPADDRGGRGGRGRGDRDSGHGVSRGRGFRDGGRGVVRGARPGNARGAGFSAKIDDDSAFPTLGRN